MNYNQDQRNFSDFTVLNSEPITGGNTIAKKFMANVFLWMFIALGVSAFCAYQFASNVTLFNMLYPDTEQGRHMSGFGWLVTLAPFAFLLIMNFGFARLSQVAITALFLAFALAMGISLSSVLLVYTASSVVGCFAASSAMFGVMAFMGYTTSQDLTSMGKLLTMGLIGIVVASIINMFLHNGPLDFIISIVGVAVFTGLTAYDVQKLKRIGAGLEYEGVGKQETAKLAIMGAMSLYLDFINLFLMILRLFGSRRD